jgi:hypothetical protein
MSHLENYLGIDDVPYQESTFLRICTQSFAKMNPAECWIRPLEHRTTILARATYVRVWNDDVTSKIQYKPPSGCFQVISITDK